MDQEHVQAASVRLVAVEPRLEVTDGSFVRFDDVRVDLGTGDARQQFSTGELLVVPVAGDLGIGVPPDEKVDIGFDRCPDDGQVAAEWKTRALLCRPLSDEELTSQEIAEWRMNLSPGYRFEATQAVRQVLVGPSCGECSMSTLPKSASTTRRRAGRSSIRSRAGKNSRLWRLRSARAMGR